MTIWTDNRCDHLRLLHKGGLSAAEIADQLEGDFSRNAVIGKIHRLGLIRDWERPGGRPTGPRRTRTAPRRQKLSKIVLNEPETFHANSEHQPLHISDILDLKPHHCRWAYGDSPFTWCGCQRVLGSMYCHVHYDQSRAKTPLRSIKVWRS